jgi:outer membrane lipoprotein-sorting protein
MITDSSIRSKLALAFAIVFLFTLDPSMALERVSPDLLLKMADDVRNPSEVYKMKIGVKTSSTDQIFEVFLKGKDKTLVIVKSPTKDRGRNMLMLDRDFHAYIPNLKKSVRLSLAQKMSGEISNGDIARTRWHGDYKATLEKEDGEESIIFLEGTKQMLTYSKIRLWVNRTNGRPSRAEFLGLDGKTVLKRAKYTSYKTIAGSLRPTELIIEDVTGKSSSITILEMNPADLPDSLFTTQSLEKVR